MEIIVYAFCKCVQYVYWWMAYVNRNGRIRITFNFSTPEQGCCIWDEMSMTLS